jgi:molybdopterin-guanine dinucleotide biosynthesis protein B
MTEPARHGLVIGIVGWKNSGKTTLAERLIAELTRRGLRVASIKHAHHTFDIDHAGTDSYRHRTAGAREVAIVSRRRWALMHETAEAEDEPSFDSMLDRLQPADVVIVEGYKSEPIAKIEVRRRDGRAGPPLADSDPHIIAIAADHAIAVARVPVFRLDDVTAIAEFVLSLPS